MSNEIREKDKVKSGVLGAKRHINIRSRLALCGDFGAGKDGVMSSAQADALLNTVMALIVDGDGVGASDLGDAERGGLEAAIYSYLALNTGSTNAADGFGGSSADSASLTWGGLTVPGATIRGAFGNDTYRFMRARALEISLTIETQYMRSREAGAMENYPMAIEFATRMDAVAARRGMTEYPQYAAVGAEYIPNLPPKIRKMVAEAAATVLGNRTHTREDARDGVMRANASVLR